MDKKIRDLAFAKRLHAACDAHPHAPDMNYGRLTWLQEQLKERFGVEVSTETCRKWFAGETRPRVAKMRCIAQLLNVDEAWLSLGVEAVPPKERRARNAMADGAVNVVAGVIQMQGWTPAFPDERDSHARESNIDLYAIIKGQQYAFHVALATKTDDHYRFTLPASRGGARSLGVVPENGSSFCFRFVELDEALISASEARGGFLEVELSAAKLKDRQIKDFAEHL